MANRSYSLKAAPAAKVIAATAALEALNRNDAENQIQGAFGQRDAHVLPTAPRASRHGTRRRLDRLRIERAIERLCGIHRQAVSCPKRVTTAVPPLPNTSRARSFKRIRLYCGSGGALSSRISPQFSSCTHQSTIIRASRPNEIAVRSTCSPYLKACRSVRSDRASNSAPAGSSNVSLCQ